MVVIPKSLLMGIVVCFLMGSSQNPQLGNPLSSYGLGSAQYLKGQNILYSLFIDTPESKWSEVQKQDTLKKLSIATDYIVNMADSYGADTYFVVDWNEDARLAGEKTVNFSIFDQQEYQTNLDREIQEWIKENIDFSTLMEEYHAKGYALVVFVNNPGTSYAIVYDGTDSPEESMVLFDREPPSVYAHEILHLFGAHDLYAHGEYTQDVSDYVGQIYPLDIMYTVTDEQGNTYNDEIVNSIYPITAYHLGWSSYTEEVDVFPQLKR